MPTMTLAQLKHCNYAIYYGSEPTLNDLPERSYWLYRKHDQWEIRIKHSATHTQVMTLSVQTTDEASVQAFLAALVPSDTPQTVVFPDALLTAIGNACEHPHWRCVTINDRGIVPIEPDDIASVNLCVHAESVPHCRLFDDKAICQPIIARDGGIYEQTSFLKYYGERYQQWIAKQRPDRGGLKWSQLLYPDGSGWSVMIVTTIGEAPSYLKLSQQLMSHESVAGLLAEKNTQLASLPEALLQITFPAAINKFINTKLTLSNPPLKATTISQMTTELFSPRHYHAVRLAISSPIPSKLDAKKMLDDEPIIGFFRPRQLQNMMLMVERKNAHHCGMIEVYQVGDPSADGQWQAIQLSTHADRDYNALTQQSLLTTYRLTQAQFEARTKPTTAEKIQRVEQEIAAHSQQIVAGKIRYHSWSGKHLINAWAWLMGIHYHNHTTLFAAILRNAGVFHNIVFDSGYEIQLEPSQMVKWITTHRPVDLLPLPNETASTHQEETITCPSVS